LTNLDKPILNYFGQRIRELREKNKLLLRQVAAEIEVDTGLMSKIERGERNPSKKQVVKIAKCLDTDQDELLTLWLADKLASAVGEEKKIALDALDIVKKKFKK
jgi:transcriptional regulator with XRE-family HTH domain